jgi:hypothetical protein
MKRSRWLATTVVVGIGLFNLTGCQVSNVFGADCTTSPPVPHHNFGTVSMTIDAPAQVAAGSTFTLTVQHMGVGTLEDPPPTAMYGSFLLTGGVSPSGTISPGSILSPAQWPVTYQLTATGQPGDTIVIAADSASRFIGEFPTNGYLLTCDTGDGGAVLATLQIVEPAS